MGPTPFYLGSRPLAAMTAADVLTTFPLNRPGKITAFRAVVKVVTTDNAAAATLNLEIGTTDLTGGVLTLGDGDTAPTITPIGKVIEATAITAANTFVAGDTISIECSAYTTYNDGEVEFWIDVLWL